MKDQAVFVRTRHVGPFASSIAILSVLRSLDATVAFSAPCLEKGGGVPTAHKVEGCRLSVKARVADFLQSRGAVRRLPSLVTTKLGRGDWFTRQSPQGPQCL